MTPRETWILEHLMPAVAARAGERESMGGLDPEAAFRLFRAADPSRNASATSWLAEVYLLDGFRLEDIAGGASSKAAGTLEAFSRHRRRLPPVERSLTRYGTLAALWGAVEPFEAARREADEAALLASATGRERRRLEREKARRESIVLREDEVATIAVPLTRFSATWWGRGTRWCTAAEHDNAFGHYAGHPLVVVTLPDGGRVQILPSSDAQIMDETDSPLEREGIRERWAAIGPVLVWMSRMHGGCLYLLPDDALSREDWIARVEADPGAVSCMPARFLDDDLLLSAVRRRPGVIQWIDPILVTPDLAEEAVSRDGWALRFVPQALRTPALWDRAVLTSAAILGFLPLEERTPERCRAAVGVSGPALRFVPPGMVDHALCELATKAPNAGSALEFIPSALMTEEICRHALAVDPMALRGVPRRFVTPEVVSDCLRRDPRSVQHVPEDILTEEMCRTALAAEASIVFELPDAVVTEAMYLDALGRLGENHFTRPIPQPLRTPGFCERVSLAHPARLDAIPEDMRTPAICRRAVEADARQFCRVPHHLMDEELGRLAVRGFPGSMAWMPGHLVQILRAEIPPEPEVALLWDPGMLDGLRQAIGESLPRTAMPGQGVSCLSQEDDA